jgi:hypothetical protein
MIAVIVIQTANDRAAAILLPKTLRIVTRGKWSFRFYQVGAFHHQEFREPTGNALIISYQTFPTLAATDAWVCGHAETVQ